MLPEEELQVDHAGGRDDVAPRDSRKGTADSTAIVMQVHTGVCRRGDTFASGLENGSVLSRDIQR